jgi:uncharacterized oxidoreductase
MAFTGVTVIELIPPAVETPLYRDEALAREMKLPKGMDVEVFAKKVIAGIEAGKLEVRPGLAINNVMKILSRIAPEFTLVDDPVVRSPVLNHRNRAQDYIYINQSMT